MRRKQKYNPAQLPLGFPPDIQPSWVGCWHRLQSLYPTHVVFLIKDRHYVTFHAQAQAVLYDMDATLRQAAAPSCALPLEHAQSYFAVLCHAGMHIVICDPPEDPTSFIFT